MNTKTSTSEARRPGRPPKADAEKSKQCSVYLSPESQDILALLPGRSASEKVNWALAQSAKTLKQEGGSGERASA
ncbi:hypothetical protein BUE60_11340 [Pseudomonas syringae pv. actinidiae]|nr:hypothetical protein BUE60_11340 [Pseudomonas syringae pv. actinidiae]